MNMVKCQICGKECSGKEADEHKKETGHNKWTLILPKRKRSNEAEDIEI